MLSLKNSKRIILILLSLIVVTLGYAKYNNMSLKDLGFKILNTIKNMKGSTVNINKLTKVHSPSVTHDDWTALLDKHVTVNGQVNYKGFIQDSAALEKYLRKLSTHPPGKNWSSAETMAYWINAYNAFTVKLIIDHYPVVSIKDIKDGLPIITSPWDIKFFKIGNIDCNLNAIEHQILRVEFDDPRIHFAINCASFSCPKLRNEAFTPSDLENQLDDQAKDFVSDPSKNIISDTESKLSSIFDWFKSDFEKQMPLLDYIQQYNQALNKSNKVEFIDYNWTLNE